MFGARIKIIWEEQRVDPPIHYINTKRSSIISKDIQIEPHPNRLYNDTKQQK